MSTRARRHHTVPQFLLKRFSDEEGQLVMADRTGRAVLTSPVNAAVETDFYTLASETGPDDALEQALSRVEASAAAAIARIDEGVWPPSDEDKVVLGGFIALQFVRGRSFRTLTRGIEARATRLMLQTAALEPESVRAVIREVTGDDPSEETLASMIEWMKSPEFEVKDDVVLTAPGLAAVPDLVPLVAARVWQLVDTAGHHLAISDAPVSLWDAPKQEATFWGSGLGTADAIVMPLGVFQCLVLPYESQAGETRRTLGPEFAAQINIRETAGMDRFLFLHPEMPLAKQLLDGPEEPQPR